jgi:hypothetical protein
MKPTIAEVKEFGPDHWEVSLSWPNGHYFMRIKSRRDCPDELAVYMAVLKEIEEEQTYGTYP